MNKKYWNICLKWGAILGVSLSLMEIIKMFSRRIQFGNVQIFTMAMIILYILILYWGGKQFKEHYTKRLSFAKAFLVGTLISLVGSVILFGYTLFHYSVIEKDGLEKKYDSALYNFKESILNDTITKAELTHYLDTVRQTMFAEETIVSFQDSVDTALCHEIHHGITLLENYYRKKMSFRPQLDTALHYQLRNFTSFSRRTMMNTLIAYIAQNEKAASTPYVRMIVENTNAKMVDFDPGETRYRQQKNHVPHYDKSEIFASVNAAMELLYGMFFSIFVALYLYRSKNPIEEPQENQTSEPVSPMEQDDNMMENVEVPDEIPSDDSKPA